MLPQPNSTLSASDLPYFHKDMKPYDQGFVTVSEDPPHALHYREFGNPKGEPLMVLHGGPGYYAPDGWAGMFNPNRYRIILFDQRGCGRSEPKTSENAEAGLADNDTGHLVEDIEKLRAHLGIEGPMHVFGGSWGSTLAMAYGMEHPDHVASLILRGIFLCRDKDLKPFYQGNAANLNDRSPEGAYKAFEDYSLPDNLKQEVRQAWQNYVNVIEPKDRGDMIAAYAEIFKNPPSAAKLEEAVKAWSVWEGITSHLVPDVQGAKEFGDPTLALSFARTENHYFMNGGFLGGEGEGNRGQDYLVENAARLKNIPHIYVVHGIYDQVCPKFQADEMVNAMRQAGIKVDYRETEAGHSMLERETARQLADIMDRMPELPGYEKSHVQRAREQEGQSRQVS